MSKHMLTKFICWVPLLVLMLSSLVLAQTPQMPLPACTAEIVDTDGRDEAIGGRNIDVDSDGLIEIYDLESLNEMRYQLDGSGHKTSAGASKNTEGCPESGCIGYELVKDLDFKADDSYRTTSNKVTWTTGSGWSPIGSDSNRFSGVFEGNGFMIANLYIDRSSSENIGLFSVTGETAQINNIKLSDVNVTGDNYTGSLVGFNYGSIISIDVTGAVLGDWRVGGLVGENGGQISKSVANVMVTGVLRIGGLVGQNETGVIRESRASGNVIGGEGVGGLVGLNINSIANSYAEGTASGDLWMGGLVGRVGRTSSGVSSIVNSYAIGKSSGKASFGGLMGSGVLNGSITASYWDTEASMTESRDDFEAAFAKTTVEMQSPTGPGTTTTTEIYYGWSTDIWDFGSTSTYPVLRSVGSFAVDGSMPYDAGIEVAIDVDKDGDGLIEICDLEGINEMRYQLDGSGYKASAVAPRLTQGCPESGCIGYELVKDLDFKADDSYRTISNKETWTMGSGWPPIGSDADRFSGVFEGNGHTIANLYISRGPVTHRMGLFSVTADIAKINNIKLPDVNVEAGGDTGSLVGFNHGSIISSNVTGAVHGAVTVGGLVGKNAGQIIFSFANVTVTSMKVDGALESGDYIGGLVGWNEGSIANTYAEGDVSGNDNVGGLVGWNVGSIANTYAEGDVSGNDQVGGLVGWNEGGITNTYAEGDVSGNDGLGGLVGQNHSGKITNSYAIGKPSGSMDIGGLVGLDNSSLVVTASYWDTDTTGLATSDGDVGGRTTVQLQSSLAPGLAETDTYYGWANEVWYFGSTNTYPLLRFTVDADGDGILDGDADNRVDIDQDGDGLIEIYDLEGLNEMRYQLDGSGYRASADATKITRGCPAAGCRGYELMKDLDFNTDDSYRSAESNKTAWTDPNAAGWQPIGSSDSFSSVLEGNGHTIAHLYINRSNEDFVGLLGSVAANAQVQNIRLLDVNVKGDFQIGSLAGSNEGIIINVRVTGTVSGRTNVGGLTGSNANQIISSFANVTVTASQDNAGGLVGGNSTANFGTPAFISESGASGNVMGDQLVGGLSGRNFGNIINSYAIGSATGSSSVGGLVGLCNTNCIIANTYATGTVIGTSTVGGLVGDHDGLVIASYWDTQTSGQSASAGGDPKTTAELQSPTAPGATAMATYYGWSADDWDFGNATEYPLLRVLRVLRVSVADPDRDGDLVLDVTDIDDDNDGLIEIHTIDDLHEIRHQVDGSGKKQNAEDTNNTTGCPPLGCIGYELARSLDFNDVNSYRDYRINTEWTVADYANDSDHGWHPLPAFRAVFNGNGHIIRNLQINRVTHDDAGLFGVLHRTGRIEHVELVYPDVRGRSNVGGLVGKNHGVINDSYVRDYDTNPNSRDTTKLIEAIQESVGGLVGRNDGGSANIGYIINSGAVINVQIKQNTSDDGINANAGGLVGFNINGAEIRNSYARGAVKGPCGVGGLTANNFSSDNVDPDKNSKIINSYASGTLTTGFGNCNFPGNVRSGGLAAVNSGLISNSYTTSCWASGTADVPNGRRGGVVQNNSGAIIDSHYQLTGCNGLEHTPNGSRRTSQQLQQRPTSGNLYSAWSVNEWDFGTSNQYPLIRYTVGFDKDNPECGILSLSACNALIKHQGRTATDEGSPANPSFMSGSAVTSIDAVTNVGAFILQPPQFNLANSHYKLYVQDTRTNPTDEMKVDLISGSNYEFVSCQSDTSAMVGTFDVTCSSSKGTFTFDRSHTFTFDIDRGITYSPFSLEVIPIVADSFDTYLTVNSEVNGSPATFIDDTVIRVEEGDTVRMNVADGFIVRDGINLPVSYHWYSSSGPTLISGELRGQSISFTIDDTMFRDSGSGDAIVTLEMRDQSGTTATPVIQEIPIRIFGRLSLTSDAAEVMRDEADKTLYRVVLASDQPQAIITARALNETLTVDDSAEQVSADNGDGTSLASEITVQLDIGSKVEFDITATDSDNNVTTHTVRVFRRSGAVSLQDIELAYITFDETISAPGSYVGMLPIGMKNTTITQITLTAGGTDAISIVTVQVNSSTQQFTADKDFAEPGTELTLTRSRGSLRVNAGSVISLTVRTRDTYIDETRASATLADLPYNEGIYTITIENTQPIDNDNDGLIDIYTLEDLDEIRNQYTNMPSTCGSNGNIACRGFELRRSLDFNDADSYEAGTINTAWTTGFGWQPILASDFSLFNRVFEGNGFTISGLYIISIGSGNALFTHLGADGVIKNVGLLDVSIRGNSNTGSLVGESFGSIINSYVTTATIVGGQKVGGLIGGNRGTIINSYVTAATIVGDQQIGGLAGSSSRPIISSFADTDVIGITGDMGGLVGYVEDKGKIINTYAAGTVSSTQTVVNVGGLVGVYDSNSENKIRNSYTISRVMPLAGSSRFGGLVGDYQASPDGSIDASYWDKTVNADLTASDDAKTTAELQNPTAPGATSADTYYGWRTEAWDFGDSIHYPTLYYATTDAITVSACADNPPPSSALPRCGSRIPNQAIRDLIPALPDLEVSEITINAQPPANDDDTINEGSNVSLMVNATDGSESYSYTWSQISGNTLELESSTSATVSFTTPSDLVEQDATTAVLTFQVEVSDGFLTISRSAIITIFKINNGNPAIAVDDDVNVARLRIIATAADADGAGSFSYQWQQLVSGGWMDIPDATTAAYWLPADVDARIQYRVEVTHTDGQGYTTNYPIQGPFRIRIDDDNDGLIDIYTLEDLDAIRHQYSNIPARCGSSADVACNGFELRRSLDFNAVESYQSGMTDPNWTTSTGSTGWLPIRGSVDERFNRVFEGNGFTISGLYINRPQSSFVGLFGALSSDIKNIGLSEVNIQGDSSVGGLVGSNLGSIINSYASGAVSGNSYVGGLVGYSESGANIINSYASGAVSGNSSVGGLVGWHRGRLRNTYATGDVSLTSESGNRFGGLVGTWITTGSIRNSYAIGRVIPGVGNARDVGGLIGNTTGTVISSYWNTQTSGRSSSAGGDGAIPRSTAQLRSPTDPGATSMDTYYGWSDNDWDFGSSQDYPALRYAGGGLNACNADILTPSDLPQCGSRLPNQEHTEGVDIEVSEVTISSQPAANDDGTINEESNVSLMVNVIGGSGSYSYVWSQTSGKALSLTTTDTVTLNVAIPSDFVEQDATTAAITFQVEVNDGMSTISRSAIITIIKINNRSNFDIEVDVSRSRLRVITAGTDADGVGSFSYQWQQLVSGGWMDIPDATTATYWLPADADDRIQYRVELMHTDGQGYTTEYPIQGPFRVRLDDDNNGLIDIYTLEDLDAIRNQYSNIPTRCGSSADIACNGFELRRSLDFNAAESYQSDMTDPDWTTSTGSTGWLPIGSVDEPFNRVFDGNGFTISGLYINRPQSTYVGLFSVSHSEIKNIGLLDVNIIGGNRVGGLVGRNGTGANIINSYVTGAVTGTDFTTGGLVGSHYGSILNSYANGTVSGSILVGGLIGYSETDANIINSYASGAVSGEDQVGGLVGQHRGRLRNTYATGDVSLTSTSDNSLGGLVGHWEHTGSIRNSYATGRVIPGADNARDAGGLIGNTTGTAISSYWDGEASGWNISDGSVTSRTTMELQSPTAPGATAMDVYYGWGVSDWDFGDDEEYPVLRYIAGGMNACTTDISTLSDLPQCGNLLPDQGRTADFAVSEVTISSQPEANNDDTINEGSNVSLRVNAIGGSEEYSFVWSQTSGQSVVLTTTDTATLNVAIAPDFIAEDLITTTLTFTVMVDDGMSSIMRSKMITITKIDNGTLAVEVDVNPARLRIISTEADPDGSSGVFSYQWQKQELGGEWEDIGGATTATYGLPADASASVRYRVTISYTDDQGYPTEYQSRSFRSRLDDDGDGLIDIYTLEDLDDIRNQYASMPSTCAAGNAERCRGFELRRSLDFNAVESYQSNTINTEWTTGRGWTPIGFGNATAFGSLFDGNGYTLSGLLIDSSANVVALFSTVGATGQINNIGLLDVDVSGRWNVGSLVGENYGSIINSYVTGEVSGSANNVGGLVGLNGYAGSILSSFATAEVSGFEAVGGLVGWHTGRITNSYASGTVSLTATSDLALGGLVGQVGANDGAIINSYAISRVMPGVDNARDVGGLVGVTTGTVIASYWDTQTSEQSSSAGGDGAIPRTTVQLQSPTAPGATPMDSYYGWDSKIWDFGDNNHYPALRYTSGGLNACNDDITLSSMSPLCGLPLPQQSDRDKGLGQLLVTAGDDDISEQLMPTFSPLGVNYELLITSTETVVQLTLRPYALNTNAMITITDQDGSSYFSGKPNGVLSDPIRLSDQTTLTIVVTDNIAESMVDTTYILTISKIAPLAISGVMLSATTIAEGSTATVTFDVSGGTGVYQYAYKLIAAEDEIALPSLAPPAVLMMPIDIVAAADSERAVELNIIVSDDSGRRVEPDETLTITIEKVDNGLAKIEAIRATSRTVTVKVSGDPDGDADDPNYTYQWQWSAAGGEGTAQWTEIEGAIDASYDISDDLAIINNEFRVQVMYTDKQAYQATLTSNTVRYDFLPSCTMAIADSDGDDAGATIDIDKDGDGLIELCDLEGINEMRYQLDGNGYKTSVGATSSRRGCPLVDGEEQCRGYELVQSLDFAEVASYRENTMNSAWTAGGSGWLPIDADFASVFEGNGHSIANLYINRTEAASGSEQGLFSTLATTAQINNIQLLDVNITGLAQVAALSGSNSGIIRNSSASGEVMANSDVGGLVGRNDGHIISSFATVAVTADMNGGGLVGHNQGSLSDSQAFGEVMGGSRLGGLSGVNDGSIISSYATATVNGSDTSSNDIGGLVGHNNNVITNSYATGAVSATGNNIGGLVGFNNNGRIVNTYAEGGVMGASQVGGLIGRHHGSLRDSYVALGAVSGSGSDIGGLIGIINTTATVIASYWDSDTSGQVSSAGGESKTTAELQTATAPGTTTTAVYYNWSDNDWDFGDSHHYPALRYASDDDLNSCVIDITTSTMALPCTILLSGQSDRDKGLSTIFFFSDDLSATVTTEPLFSPLTNSYMVTIVTRAERVRLTLRPYAINPAATITVTDPADNNYFADKATGALSDGILFEDDIMLSIVVSDILGEDTVHTTYTFAITSELPPLIVSDLSLNVQPPANTDGTINEGSTATLTFNVSGGTGVYQYASQIDDAEYTPFVPPFIYSIAADFIATDATTQTVTLTIRVSDQSDEIEDFEHTEVLPILKTNNGSADINLSITSATLTAIVGADPDGDATTPSYQYQWQSLAKTGADWMDIEGATDASYTIGDEVKSSAEFRVQVMYTDGQGYQEMPTSKGIRYTLPGSGGLRIRIKVFLEGPLR